MPDIFLVMGRRWRLILSLTLAGTVAAYVASLVSAKLYLSTTTALPVNSQVNDKARIFNQNIEGLYSEIGSADELDKVEGTAKLDTVFLAVASAHHLAAHYNLDTNGREALDAAAQTLRNSSNISRTGYGELKIQVWDKNNDTAATLANALMQTINAIHERLQTENNRMVLQKLKEEYAQKTGARDSFESRVVDFRSVHDSAFDNHPKITPRSYNNVVREQTELNDELKQYAGLINEYELAVKTTPKVLLVVEQARPSSRYDRPKTSRNVLLAFLASLLFSFLLAVFVEGRKRNA